ncbi:GNAT family N-acetyltransferase [Natranaerobius thermophilus]|uniref:GCN5-related N-acetyltransferase n=1 Tax=Natranaerobius thermophilus (strain ATCC BAA-1301 / DSM 18059 / JW/NM-WN-LF) TaxID=457570 RepID=B2A6E7_NATTJ|nr:GNAT family N-acetyltransferase [Natranaerobius thermophilus]ACB84161.1 GCN5-related N-acetyltransferase [Natranaerobius thermophilus JW/NM-WN-LF]
MGADMNIEIKTFDELTLQELYAVIKARIQVFVVEQNCPYMECDDLDQMAYHCFIQSSGNVVAYARVIPPGYKFQEASMGRLLTIERVRGTGLGLELMEQVMSFMCRQKNWQEIRIEAQKYLESFYKKFHFRTVSDTFILDGIEHIEMLYQKG